MHDPKFEKDVQQKMEELVFTPSEEVWLKVEKAVNGEKKRRFLPFWLFFLPACLLVGAGALYFSGSHHPGSAAPVANATHPGASQSDAFPPPGTDQSVDQSVAARPGAARTLDVPPAPGATGFQPAARLQSQPQLTGRNRPVSIGDPGTGTIRLRNPGGRSTRQAAGNTGIDPRANDMMDPTVVDPTRDAAVDLAPNTVVDRAPNTVGDRASAATAAHRAFSPGLSRIDRHSSAITASPLTSLKAPTAAKTRLPEPKRPWEAGFTGGIGISSLNQGLLDKSTVTSPAYRNYASAVTGVPQTYVSAIQPDLSFWAGILLQKSLRKDFSLSLGLNLHYYSSRIRTGGKVTASSASAAASSSSFILGNSLAAAAQAYPYYSPGNNQSFTNRYYFMELPGSISWQVGHSKRMPMFWEGGFSLSYLVSSNSLYYDPKSGVFYKDGSVINRTQANVFTDLMVGLPLRGMRIQAGPQIQYGFTNLLNNEGAGGQHLLYGGIKLLFLPGKRAGARVRGQ